MPRLVLQLEKLWRGTGAGFNPLLTLPTGGTSSPDPLTRRFESGMLGLVLHFPSFSRGTRARFTPFPTLPTDATSYLDLVIIRSESGMLRPVLQLGSL